MKQQLDLNTWARKDHFHFFGRFEEPFFLVFVKTSTAPLPMSRRNLPAALSF